MAKYRYVYYWVCVDLCYGGAKRGPYNTKGIAIASKPNTGLWLLKKCRVNGPVQYKGYEISQTIHGPYMTYIGNRFVQENTIEGIKQIIDKYDTEG